MNGQAQPKKETEGFYLHNHRGGNVFWAENEAVGPFASKENAETAKKAVLKHASMTGNYRLKSSITDEPKARLVSWPVWLDGTSSPSMKEDLKDLHE